MRRLLKIFAVLAALAVGILVVVWYLITVPVWAMADTREALTNSDQLREHVVAISHEIGSRPHNRLDKLDDTADYIFERFSLIGTPQFQEYEARGQTYKNVVLQLKGNQYCESDLYVVGAHYDTHDFTPGADDNASGVAGLIELARAIAERPLPCDVELVAYSLEEPPNFRTPNMGSFHHAQSLKKRGVPLTLMISLEMIGYFSDEPDSQNYPAPIMKHAYGDRGDFIGVIGDLDNRSHIRALKRSFIETGRVKTKAISAPSFVQGIDFSDHLNYIKFDFPAIMVSDTSFYRNANYHRATDTFDTLDYEKMAAVVDSVYYALLDVIGQPAP